MGCLVQLSDLCGKVHFSYWWFQNLQADIEVNIGDLSKYDECNALVLPSAKQKTKVIKKKKTNQRILSKTQRKKLEKVVEIKKKKANVIKHCSIVCFIK